MNQKPLKNISASIHQRLKNKAEETGRGFNDLLQYYFIERFLYRLSKSSHQNRFILKGALMFNIWSQDNFRPTRDIDLLGKTTNDIQEVVKIFKSICDQNVEDDGVFFHPETMEGTRITEDADYEGVRIRFKANLGNTANIIQIDIGFEDSVFPSSVQTEYPTILDLPAPHLQGYTRESSIAEKFAAMVQHKMLNSRMKDYFDIWILSKKFDFEGEILMKAIEKAFSVRKLEIPLEPSGLSDDFANDETKIKEWAAFKQLSQVKEAPGDLQKTVFDVRNFLIPVSKTLAENQPFKKYWQAPGPWVTKKIP